MYPTYSAGSGCNNGYTYMFEGGNSLFIPFPAALHPHYVYAGKSGRSRAGHANQQFDLLGISARRRLQSDQNNLLWLYGLTAGTYDIVTVDACGREDSAMITIPPSALRHDAFSAMAVIGFTPRVAACPRFFG